MIRRCLSLLLAIALPLAAAERVRLGDDGVIRWTDDGREVALFGGNYTLPSASDYRAAGRAGADRKKLIQEDLTHFARMGWDAARLAIWGDWENSDRAGNLIANDHLDLFDYLIAEGKKRGLSFLFTPIHRHDSRWPDKMGAVEPGFSYHFPMEELGRNPQAIAAQQNYLRQILKHVNPYTGIALKDEPSILFIELINEPYHHPENAAAEVRYINALVDAIRETGCQKILFHNVSQDFRMGPVIAASRAQGLSFAWYPTGLIAGRALEGNPLRYVDDYAPLARPDIPPLPRIVYEFDGGDLTAASLYPAMVRQFRAAGAQFATMFGYDMLATAPRNLGWQTHYLNLVYSPRKAMSAVIAAEAMRQLPRGATYGAYPENRRFGPVRVDGENDTAELITTEQYLSAGDTRTAAPAPHALRRVAGVGSSPLVSYEGTGAYFLDRVDAGRWRLEVYPDAHFVRDPFTLRHDSNLDAARIDWREWPITLALPDLGNDFIVTPLNPGNHHHPVVTAGQFPVRPGVYLINRRDVPDRPLPERLGPLGLSEFVCPAPSVAAPEAISRLPTQHRADQPLQLEFDVLASATPRLVQATVSRDGQSILPPITLRRGRGARWSAEVPADTAWTQGPLEVSLSADFGQGQQPLSGVGAPWTVRLLPASAPTVLFAPEADANRWFAYTPPGPYRGEYLALAPAAPTAPAHVRITAPAADAPAPTFHALSVPVKRRLQDTLPAHPPETLVVEARGNARWLRVALIESDGTAWGVMVPLSPEWHVHRIPLASLQLGDALKLPVGFPGNWNYALTPPVGRGIDGDRVHLVAVEHVQISIAPAPQASPEIAADVRRIELLP